MNLSSIHCASITWNISYEELSIIRKAFSTGDAGLLIEICEFSSKLDPSEAINYLRNTRLYRNNLQLEAFLKGRVNLYSTNKCQDSYSRDLFERVMGYFFNDNNRILSESEASLLAEYIDCYDNSVDKVNSFAETNQIFRVDSEEMDLALYGHTVRSGIWIENSILRSDFELSVVKLRAVNCIKLLLSTYNKKGSNELNDFLRCIFSVEQGDSLLLYIWENYSHDLIISSIRNELKYQNPTAFYNLTRLHEITNSDFDEILRIKVDSDVSYAEAFQTPYRSKKLLGEYWYPTLRIKNDIEILNSFEQMPNIKIILQVITPENALTVLHCVLSREDVLKQCIRSTNTRNIDIDKNFTKLLTSFVSYEVDMQWLSELAIDCLIMASPESIKLMAPDLPKDLVVSIYEKKPASEKRRMCIAFKEYTLDFSIQSFSL